MFPEKCICEGCENPKAEGELYCTECLETIEEEEQEFIEDGLEVGAFIYTETIYCPYCAAVQEALTNESLEHLYTEGTHNVVCLNCNMIFNLETNKITEFSSYRTDVELTELTLEEEDDY